VKVRDEQGGPAEAHAVPRPAEPQHDAHGARVLIEREAGLGPDRDQRAGQLIPDHNAFDRAEGEGRVPVPVAQVGPRGSNVLPVRRRERIDVGELHAVAGDEAEAPAVKHRIARGTVRRGVARRDRSEERQLHTDGREAHPEAELVRGDHDVLRAAGDRVAGVDPAAAAGRRRARRADARLAGLFAVAEVAVDARRTIRDRGAQAAGLRVAGLGRARIVVRAADGGARLADAGVADLDAVAEVAVAARRAVRHRRVIAAGRRVAQVGGAVVVVVAVEHGARRTDASLARLAAVAQVPVAARRAVGRDPVLAAGDGVAGVDGARVPVVAVERDAMRAAAVLARVVAVAHVGVATRGPVRDHGVLAAGDRIAGVRGTRVGVGAGERGARGAHAGLTRLGAVVKFLHLPAREFVP